MNWLRLTPLVFIACAHSLIEGTTIRDTDENRQVLAVLTRMHGAMEARDGATLLSLVSAKYFEDMGTPDPKDDYGYEQFKNEVLPKSMGVTKEFHIMIQVHEIVVDGEKAHADVRYNSRALLDLPSGTLWDSHREFSRLKLAREAGDWKIVGGL